MVSPSIRRLRRNAPAAEPPPIAVRRHQGLRRLSAGHLRKAINETDKQFHTITLAFIGVAAFPATRLEDHQRAATSCMNVRTAVLSAVLF